MTQATRQSLKGTRFGNFVLDLPAGRPVGGSRELPGSSTETSFGILIGSPITPVSNCDAITFLVMHSATELILTG
ncbi:hypothetical protein V1294_004368 [Bradyrhizobium sp. AZCC 1678]|uniref:hypothetical protein n=1 Tax=Bradyrhizobium sp. AZCC 1678 TaxID=3117030 RepID=UPI002FF25B99